MLVVTKGHLVAQRTDNSEVLGYGFSGTLLVSPFDYMSDILCSGRPRSGSEARCPPLRLGQLFKPWDTGGRRKMVLF